jgi:ubiquinone/menaquinone biosynthesis C-methylase UbiE
MSASTSSNYIMGHDDRERRRLIAQAAILDPITEQLLHRAGLKSGMSVLDFGCGVGDVSMIAARLVGPSGQVMGLDIDKPTLTLARQRALEQGLNITLERTSIVDFRPETPVDAAIGRHILIHMPEPLAVLQTAFAALKSGGVAVFQEYDFSVLHPAYPCVPLRDRVTEIFRDFFLKSTRGNVGTQLYHLAVQAGFCSVECRAEYGIGGGPDSPYYEWFAESLRSVLPRIEALGELRVSDIDIDTLATRLRQEAVANASCFPAPVMIGCIARKP